MHFRLALLMLAALPVASQTTAIQDNSFLIEEAYNQERGVVQHISTFTRLSNSKDWSYTFTQEWPAPRNWRHQISFTAVVAHAGAFAGSGAGFGDSIVNYRYQLLGDGQSRVAFAPRVSFSVPTGNFTRGRGAGAPGLQTNLPLSIVLHRRLVTHLNAGGTFVRAAQDADRCRANTFGYTLGQSLVYLAHPRFNVLLEAIHSRYQSVVDDRRTAWSGSTYLSPGVRWAHNFSSGLHPFAKSRP
jgi:hypothetical protein